MDEAVYPLTLYDNMCAGIIIDIGWLVEGSVDISRLKRALDNVTAKWSLLNGRIEKVNVRVSAVRIHIFSAYISEFLGDLSTKSSTPRMPEKLQALHS